MQPSLGIEIPRSGSPFVKWVGGKRSLLSEILQWVPQDYKTYHEPFVGGGAVFFSLSPKQASLSDVNQELCICYQTIRDEPEDLIRVLARHKALHCKDYYYSVRAQDPASKVEISARLIYLNKTCFNGLYRVNKSGGFNSPMGSYKSPNIQDADNIWACHEALQGVEIKNQGFGSIVPKKGDFVYADPPYDQTFTQYTAGKFGEKDQLALRDQAVIWAKKGAKVMLSNSATDFIREIYSMKPFVLTEVQVAKPVNCKKDGRGKIPEFLIRSWA